MALELICGVDFVVQPALQDDPRRSGGVLGPSLAEYRIANEAISQPLGCK
jgi:hypothetical protein